MKPGCPRTRVAEDKRVGGAGKWSAGLHGERIRIKDQ